MPPALRSLAVAASLALAAATAPATTPPSPDTAPRTDSFESILRAFQYRHTITRGTPFEFPTAPGSPPPGDMPADGYYASVLADAGLQATGGSPLPSLVASIFRALYAPSGGSTSTISHRFLTPEAFDCLMAGGMTPAAVYAQTVAQALPAPGGDYEAASRTLTTYQKLQLVADRLTQLRYYLKPLPAVEVIKKEPARPPSSAYRADPAEARRVGIERWAAATEISTITFPTNIMTFTSNETLTYSNTLGKYVARIRSYRVHYGVDLTGISGTAYAFRSIEVAPGTADPPLEPGDPQSLAARFDGIPADNHYRHFATRNAGSRVEFPWVSTGTPFSGSGVQRNIGFRLTSEGAHRETYPAYNNRYGPFVIVDLGADPQWSLPDPDACDACTTGHCIAGDADFANNSVEATFSLGSTDHGTVRGKLQLAYPKPFPHAYGPESLQVLGGDAFGRVDHPETGRPAQFYGPDTIAAVTGISDTGYNLEFYERDQSWTPDPDTGLFPVTGQSSPELLTTVTIINPDPTGESYNGLEVTRTTGSEQTTTRFSYDASASAWTLATDDGDRLDSLVTTVDGDTRTEARTVYDADHTALEETTTTIQLFPWGEETVATTTGSGPDAITTHFSYYDDPETDAAAFGKLRQTTSSEGPWTRYHYGANLGHLTAEIHGFGDTPAPPADAENDPDDPDDAIDETACRIVRYTRPGQPAAIDPDTTTTVESVQGFEVARHYTTTTWAHTTRTTAIHPGTAPDDPSNLTATTTLSLHTASAGLPEKTTHADGTVTLYSYTHAPTGTRTTTVQHGVPAPGDTTTISSGTVTATTVNAQGHTVRTTTTDAATGLVVLDDHTPADATDTFGRPTSTFHLGGLTSTTTYDCCGVSTSTDRYGATTSYTTGTPLTFDNPITGAPLTLEADTVTAPVPGGTLTTATATSGRLTYQFAIATDGTTAVRSITETDTAGRTRRLVEAVGNDAGFATTTVAESRTPQGNRTRTTTYPGGAVRTETYYLDGRLKSVTGSATAPHRFEYGASADGERFTTRFLIDHAGTDTGRWQRTVTGMDGRVLREESPSESAPGGIATTTYGYDAAARLVSKTDPDGVTELYAYDALGRRDTTALDRNRNGRIDFDGDDRITRTVRAVARLDPDDDTSATVNRTTTLTWTTSGDPAPTTRHQSLAAVTGLDSWEGEPGALTHRSLGFGGTAWSETALRPDGTYLVRTFAAGTGTTTATGETLFDATDTPVSTTATTYDAFGRIATTTTTGHGERTAARTYYPSGHPHTTTTSAPPSASIPLVTDTFTYDGRGRLVREHSTATGQVDHTYDDAGRRTASTGQSRLPLHFVYGLHGRLLQMQSRPDTPEEATTEWRYHPLSGLLAEKRFPGASPGQRANTKSFTYTAAGRPHTRTNGRGHTATHTYLPSGELASLTYDDNRTPAVAYTYGRPGQLATRTDAAGHHVLATSPDGRPAGTTTTAGLLAGTAVALTYDTLGRRTNLHATVVGETTAVDDHYTYDSLSRLASVRRGPHTATYTAAPGTLLLAHINYQTHQNTVLRTTRTHDALARLASLSATLAPGSGSPATVSSFAYTYDTAGRRTAAALADGSQWNYTYGPLGGLTAAARFATAEATSPLPGQSFSFTYDTFGNRSTNATAGLVPTPANPATSYTHRATDPAQLDTVNHPGTLSVTGVADPAATVHVALDTAPAVPTTRHASTFHATLQTDNTTGPASAQVTVTATLDGQTDSATTTHTVPPATAQHTYDADGNLTSDGTRTFTWDAENRLTAIESIPATLPPGQPASRTHFVVDALGRRVEKTHQVQVGGTWHTATRHRYLYDGWNLVAEIEGTDWAPRIARSYTWGTDLGGTGSSAGGAGGLLFLTVHRPPDHPAAGTHAATYDGNGNLTGLVDLTAATVSATYAYTPFGKLVQATGPAAASNPFRFSTNFHDDANGLVYYGHRYYDPSTGRWLSRDPIGENGGPNLYTFINNDPINGVDTRGLVLFSFDGTNNDRIRDAWANTEAENAPTNIAIMTELYDGVAHYIHGVGTRTGQFLGNPFGFGTKNRIDLQFARFCQYHQQHPTEPVDIIGFSRGAASARIFANRVREAKPTAAIRFLGIFDTVPQMGSPNRFNYQFGYNLDVSRQIGWVAHAVAKNEYRSLFPLTSISKTTYFQSEALAANFGQLAINAFDPDEFVEISGSNFIEKPFTGAHSDIGGGYRDWRNVNALKWMIAQGQRVGAPFFDLSFYDDRDWLVHVNAPHDSRYIIDAFQGDRVIFPGSR